MKMSGWVCADDASSWRQQLRYLYWCKPGGSAQPCDSGLNRSSPNLDLLRMTGALQQQEVVGARLQTCVFSGGQVNLRVWRLG